MRTRTGCVALALSVLSMPAMAQTVLSEADALARLSSESPRVKAIRAGVDLARADVLAANRWPNPRVTYNREAVAGVTENMFLVAQPLPISGRRGLEASAASALVEASAHRADEEIRNARAELRAAYANLVFAQVRETELARFRDQLRQLAEVLAKREAEGESAGYDRLRAERDVADIEGECATARADRMRAQGAVAAFFAAAVADNVTAIIAVVPSSPAGNRPPIPDVAALAARAETVRGEWAALRQEMASARFAARAADRRLVPEPEVVVGTKSSSLGAGDIGSVVSVHATVPLFDRARPEHALAQARLAQAEAKAAAFQIAVTAQISGLRAAILERRAAADTYRTTATENVDRLQRIAQVSYDAGERGILELLDAYRSGAAARARQATLDAAVRQAEIELEFVSGWEIQ